MKLKIEIGFKVKNLNRNIFKKFKKSMFNLFLKYFFARLISSRKKVKEVKYTKSQKHIPIQFSL